VRAEIMAYRDAIASGAMALFEEKYGDRVRVVTIDEYSRELCGGTHLATTAEVGLFLITSESSVGSGIRRIEALTGRGAATHARDQEDVLHAAAAALRVPAGELPDRVRQLTQRVRTLEAEAEAARTRAAASDLDKILAAAPDVDGITVVGLHAPGANQEALRALGDRLKRRLSSGVVVTAAAADGNLEVVVMVTATAVARGASAKDIMAVLNRRLGTRGGGRPELAQGGGGDPGRLDGVLNDLPAVVREALAAAPDRRR